MEDGYIAQDLKETPVTWNDLLSERAQTDAVILSVLNQDNGNWSDGAIRFMRLASKHHTLYRQFLTLFQREV